MAPPRANNQASAEPAADRRDPENGADESTPLLARERQSAQASSGASAAHERVRRWLGPRGITYISFILVAIIFALTIIFGGTPTPSLSLFST